MSRFSKTLMVAALAALAGTAIAGGEKFPGIGRTALPVEIKAWDIDVRPDFKGLPKGSGNVDRGQELFEEKCASCHGSFGESNEVFTPLVGGTTLEDIKNGRVKSLQTGSAPQRTTFMKVATISTIFDYVNRAMPWTSPKSLKPDDVYAILAYLLNLAEVVPGDFTLSDQNIAEVQKRMPNRNGLTSDHGMWPGPAASKGGIGNGGKPDVKNTACMKNCKSEVQIASFLPEYAWDAHGNLAEQNREVGPARGMVTTKDTRKAPPPPPHPMLKVAQDNACMGCHGINNKIVGPGYNEVKAKYKDQADAEAKLAAKVKAGGSGVWGAVPMPPQPQLKDEDVKALVKWILSGAPAN